MKCVSGFLLFASSIRNWSMSQLRFASTGYDTSIVTKCRIYLLTSHKVVVYSWKLFFFRSSRIFSCHRLFSGEALQTSVVQFRGMRPYGLTNISKCLNFTLTTSLFSFLACWSLVTVFWIYTDIFIAIRYFLNWGHIKEILHEKY
jgi:hypothetical protein